MKRLRPEIRGREINGKTVLERKVIVKAYVECEGRAFTIDAFRWTDQRNEVSEDDAFDILADAMDYIPMDSAHEFVCDNPPESE